MKKEYFKPEITELEIVFNQCLLAGSENTGLGGDDDDDEPEF